MNVMTALYFNCWIVM